MDSGAMRMAVVEEAAGHALLIEQGGADRYWIRQPNGELLEESFATAGEAQVAWAAEAMGITWGKSAAIPHVFVTTDGFASRELPGSEGFDPMKLPEHPNGLCVMPEKVQLPPAAWLMTPCFTRSLAALVRAVNTCIRFTETWETQIGTFRALGDAALREQAEMLRAMLVREVLDRGKRMGADPDMIVAEQMGLLTAVADTVGERQRRRSASFRDLLMTTGMILGEHEHKVTFNGFPEYALPAKELQPGMLLMGATDREAEVLTAPTPVLQSPTLDRLPIPNLYEYSERSLVKGDVKHYQIKGHILVPVHTKSLASFGYR